MSTMLFLGEQNGRQVASNGEEPVETDLPTVEILQGLGAALKSCEHGPEGSGNTEHCGEMNPSD
ncbi:hypothetical protein SCOR_11950 [Sulfidibacter corallicola]|uniref:Uncharacterized protein n=1 Tax=Sulfidibacter corallicola TaxID=2818388 RepID=A0A8A4TDF5_SULCO|nr:hypothetical protein [Sulfidibacter corallicola]QTD47956.1 hypothetical protein J3U87_20410 [Sulfidibacter corallicola]